MVSFVCLLGGAPLVASSGTGNVVVSRAAVLVEPLWADDLVVMVGVGGVATCVGRCRVEGGAPALVLWLRAE